jgi:pyridoxal phosphate enzyme (YggS family)
MDGVLDHLKSTLERIGNAAKRAGRKPEAVTLVAVTKTVPFESVRPYLDVGIRHIGENRVQEALEKYSELNAPSTVKPIFHLIGQLQSNKAKKAVGFFDMIQSLDRLELAQDIDRHAQALGKKQACLVEVKISPEATKSGLPPEELEPFLAQTKKLPFLDVQGLMGIAPEGSNPEEARPFFSRLRKLCEKSGLKVLSMGMSSDFEVAIEEGATIVRIGSALFGPRR